MAKNRTLNSIILALYAKVNTRLTDSSWIIRFSLFSLVFWRFCVKMSFASLTDGGFKL